jgi:hypothetical protein
MTTDHENSARILSDEDVKALADEMEMRLVSRFYGNLGRGVWDLAWKAIVICIVAIAAYGLFQEMKH